MKMVPNQKFRIGRDTFERDQEYDVDTSIVVHAVNNGWATSPEYTAYGRLDQTTHNVQPEDASHGVTDGGV